MVQENIQLSIISTKMEDALALSPILNERELRSLDATYIEWFQSSSMQGILQVPREPHGFTVLRNLMRWRYLWHRVTIHRPYLLWYMTQKEPLHQLTAEKRTAVESCYTLSAELIEDIARTWEGRRPCQFASWNATWLIYQAAMTPLLCLFCEFSDPKSVENSQRQVELALKTLTDLKPWFPTAERSLDVLNWLYSASIHPPPFERLVYNLTEPGESEATSKDAHHHRPSGDSRAGEKLQGLPLDSAVVPPNDFFGTLAWSTGWDNTMTDFDIPGIGLDYDADFRSVGEAEGEGVFLPIFDASNNKEEYFGI